MRPPSRLKLSCRNSSRSIPSCSTKSRCPWGLRRWLLIAREKGIAEAPGIDALFSFREAELTAFSPDVRPRGSPAAGVAREVACHAPSCYVAAMSGSTENIEAIARAVCERVYSRHAGSDEQLTADIEMYWHVVAAEIEAGIIDETGEYVSELDWSQRLEVYRDRMRRHPESREAWDTARFGGPLPRE